MATTAVPHPPAAARPSPVHRLWNRELERYPATGQRLLSLAIVVLTTVVLYYQLYLAGALAAGTGGKNGIIPDLDMSFVYYVNISVIGYVLGAVASYAAGLADRYGRANIVTGGLLVTALLCMVGIPLADTKLEFGVVFILLGFVEGIILVATPALIRDFSPQLGRASAMGFWTLGPVLGSLVVSLIVSNSSVTTPWRNQYVVCGIVGLVVFLIALVGLRELAPSLRDQIMVSSHDRALLEARAKGIDVAAELRNPFRQMLKLDIIGSAFAISVFLIIYYVAVGFFPVFFQTIFGYDQAKANALGNWFWAFDAAGLVLIGLLSDKLRVRKPFMLVGAIGAIVFTSIFATKVTQPGTSYSTFVVILVFLSLFLGVAYAPWMASFTETVERRNPALMATGLAVWGLIIRIVIAVSVFFVPLVVTTVTTLVDEGGTVKALAAGQDPALDATQNATVKAVAEDPTIVPRAQGLATQYSAQLATAAKLSPATTAALTATPTDPATQARAVSELSGVGVPDVARVSTLGAQDPTQLSAADLALLRSAGPAVAAAGAQLVALAAVPPADLAFLGTYGKSLQDPQVVSALTFLQQNAPAVKQAAADSPKQWQTYFWITVGGEVVFIPLIFLMAGFWDPRKAKRKEQEHEAWVRSEMAALAEDEHATT